MDPAQISLKFDHSNQRSPPVKLDAMFFTATEEPLVLLGDEIKPKTDTKEQKAENIEKQRKSSDQAKQDFHKIDTMRGSKVENTGEKHQEKAQ